MLTGREGSRWDKVQTLEYLLPIYLFLPDKFIFNTLSAIMWLFWEKPVAAVKRKLGGAGKQCVHSQKLPWANQKVIYYMVPEIKRSCSKLGEKLVSKLFCCVLVTETCFNLWRFLFVLYLCVCGCNRCPQKPYLGSTISLQMLVKTQNFYKRLGALETWISVLSMSEKMLPGSAVFIPCILKKVHKMKLVHISTWVGLTRIN